MFSRILLTNAVYGGEVVVLWKRKRKTGRRPEGDVNLVCLPLPVDGVRYLGIMMSVRMVRVLGKHAFSADPDTV